MTHKVGSLRSRTTTEFYALLEVEREARYLLQVVDYYGVQPPLVSTYVGYLRTRLAALEEVRAKQVRAKLVTEEKPRERR
jgi:hypothetical protein